MITHKSVCIKRKTVYFPAIYFCIVKFLIGLVSAQTLDTFNPNVAGYYGGGVVSTMVVQADGKVLFGQSFDLVGGLNRSDIARVDSDGSLDPYFNPESYGSVGSMAIQLDGKIIVAGSFTAMGGRNYAYLARLNPDGSVDTSFNAQASGTVYAVAPQKDGRILVGGTFTNLAGYSCNHIGRLNSDGSYDTNFNANASGVITTIALQTNGSILVGGTFTNLNGTAVSRLGRLKTDGSLDASFSPQANATVYAISVQPDNSILVGGVFTNIAGTVRNHIARLLNDGSLDISFNPGASNTVYCIALQANGKMLVSGAFLGLAGTACKYIGRLNPDGSFDGSINPVTSGSVYVVTLQKDGNILMGGSFTNLSGLQRNLVGRFNNNDTATESITNTASSITWLRGGSSPEIWCTMFEISTNGTSWKSLGNGSRIAGGWQLTGVSIPGTASLRMSGFCSVASILSESGSLIQSYWGKACVLTQPVSHDFVINSNAILSVVAGGATPLNYQWQRNGINLVNGGIISGANNATLTFTKLASTNAGFYSVVISNSFGMVTSQVASLSVVSAVKHDTFYPNFGTTYTTVFQPDNRVIIGGSFATGKYYGLGRANLDGTPDSLFGPYEYSAVNSCIAQLNGKVLIGGSFSSVGGQSHPNLGRLNSDATCDLSFSGNADGPVYAMLAQPDDKVIVAGNFTALCNQTQKKLEESTLTEHWIRTS